MKLVLSFLIFVNAGISFSNPESFDFNTYDEKPKLITVTSLIIDSFSTSCDENYTNEEILQLSSRVYQSFKTFSFENKSRFYTCEDSGTCQVGPIDGQQPTDFRFAEIPIVTTLSTIRFPSYTPRSDSYAGTLKVDIFTGIQEKSISSELVTLNGKVFLFSINILISSETDFDTISTINSCKVFESEEYLSEYKNALKESKKENNK